MPAFTRSFPFVALILGLLGSTTLAADLQLNRYFSDNMVLQRDKPATIRGTAPAGATVTVTFGKQTKTAKAAADGSWAVALDAMPTNATGQDLVVTASTGGNVSIKNVVVGDVFMFARQTTIDISLARDAQGKKLAAAHGNTPNLRAIQIKTIPAIQPQAQLADKATSGWAAVTPDNAKTMSAAAYLFARDLDKQVEVPIGVIDLNMGGHFPIGWLSREALLQTESLLGRSDVPGMLKRLENLAELEAKGEPFPRKEVIKANPVAYPLYPAAGYNAVLHPLRGTALKGMVLQIGGNYPYLPYTLLRQTGENLDRTLLNEAYVKTYDIRKNGHRMDPFTTPRVPREWRKALGDDKLPIGLVMAPGSALATMGQHSVEMRELQRQMSLDNPNVSIIVPNMEAVPFSVQPQDEAVLAKRSLHWALGDVYGEGPGVASGPLIDRVEMAGDNATVYFKAGTAKGLKAITDKITGFEVAGVEGDYIPAMAKISGDTVKIETDKIGRIARVRYNWRHFPKNELVNAAGLPAVPFRTERAKYDWFHTHSENDLPMEYYTPASEWKGGDVTLVNGRIKTFGYMNFAGWLGPVGVRVGPFGPNMGVRDVLIGSPAESKLKVGDVIYSANGKMLGEEGLRRSCPRQSHDSETIARPAAS
jgi:sialate O-acetylesterase